MGRCPGLRHDAKDPEKPEDDLKNMYRTAKKKLNPGFVIDPGTQENMIHAILFMRRIEFMPLGMRWFDTPAATESPFTAA